MHNNNESEKLITLKSKVFYPSHGAGTVIKEKKIEFAGEVKKYYEFSFINKKLTISTPVYNVNKLGIRHVLPHKDIISKISILKKKPTLDAKLADYNELMTKIEELDLEGEVSSFVLIIQYCNFEKAQREKEGRLIPVSISKNLKNSKTNLIGELAVSQEISFDDASEEFEKLTGLDRP